MNNLRITQINQKQRNGKRSFWRTVGLVLAVWFIAGIVSGCSPGEVSTTLSADVVSVLNQGADAGFERAYEPRPFDFPLDHGSHPTYRTEWWYYTGNLADDAGNQYGYQFTLFRNALTPEMPERDSELATNQIYMAHFAVTDGSANEHVSFERYSRGGDLAGAEGTPAYHIWLEDWSVQEIERGVYHMQVATDAGASDERVAIDFILREQEPIVFHGDAGLSQKGEEPGNASYYYSLVGVDTSGTITINGNERTVSGVSWMDHEFGTSALSENAVGWDWFSLQLDNGAKLMFAQIRGADGASVGSFEGTYVAPDRQPHPIDGEDFTLSELATWTSSHTGITYPSGWQVTFPEYELELTLEPLIRDQEMQVSFVYWEGAVNASGTMAGEPVSGVGYVELTGYGSQIGDYQR